MALEDTIAALTQQAGLLLDLPQQIANAATAKVATLTSLYEARASSKVTTVYVDPILGSDANVGTQAAPYKSLKAAVEKSQTGAVTEIQVNGDCAVDSDIYISSRTIIIRSINTNKHQLIPTRYIIQGQATPTAGLYGFRLGNGGHLILYNLDIRVPANDGTWPAFSQANCFVISHWPSSIHWSMYGVVLSSCSITYDATNFGYFMEGGYPHSYVETSVAVINQTSLNGLRYKGYTATAGTAVTTLPWLISNLVNI